MRIGQLVKHNIRKIFHYCDSEDHNEYERLTSLGYSKDTFGINFPFCTELDQIPADQSRRYWRETYIVRGRNVRVSSQWFVGRTQQFCDYLIRLGIVTQEELTELIDAPNETTVHNTRNNRQANRNSRYRGNAIGNAQNLVVRNILSNLGQESFNEGGWESTKAYFSHQCAYCGDEGSLVIDHAIPINRSSLGEHRLGNLVPSCKSCNARKADRGFLEFLADAPQRIEFIQNYMDSKNYVPLGDNDQVAMVLNMAYKEVSSVADRYIAILNELFPNN
jgi:5-methylcytosine-specific restriction endonuclease McrA